MPPAHYTCSIASGVAAARYERRTHRAGKRPVRFREERGALSRILPSPLGNPLFPPFSPPSFPRSPFLSSVPHRSLTRADLNLKDVRGALICPFFLFGPPTPRSSPSIGIGTSQPIRLEGWVFRFVVVDVHGARSPKGVAMSLDGTHDTFPRLGILQVLVASSSLPFRYYTQVHHESNTKIIARRHAGKDLTFVHEFIEAEKMSVHLLGQLRWRLPLQPPC